MAHHRLRAHFYSLRFILCFMSRAFLPFASSAFFAFLPAAILLCGPSCSFAADNFWSAASGDWSDTNPCPWSLGVEPTSSDNAYITNGGTANITQQGETCQGLYLGGSNTGAVQMTDGSFSVLANYVAYTGTGVFTQSAGMSNMIHGELLLGYSPGSNGTYNPNDSGQIQATVEVIGRSGTGIFNQSGGTNRVFADFVIGDSSGTGTYNLTGGTLITPVIGSLSGARVFNFGGGILQCPLNSSGYIPMTLTGINGNAKIDTAGHQVTLYSSLTGYYGGLNKIGSGTLTLNASNTYGQPTNIIAGALALGSVATLDAASVIDVQSQGTFNVSAKSGGFSLNHLQTLQGSGNVIGNIVATPGSRIVPGDSVGVLTISGNLTLNSGALLNFELADTSASDKITMTGSTLYLNGQQFSDFSFSPLSGFGQGKYILIDANNVQGSLGANLSGSVGGLPATIAISGNDLVLNVVPEPSVFQMLGTAVIALLAAAFSNLIGRRLSKAGRHLPGFYT